MRLASLPLILSALLIACANTASIPDEGAGDAGYGEAGEGDGYGATDGTGMCVDHCATNSDCQDSCPAISGDVNCCDTSTGRCYLSAATSCPASVNDSGPTSTPTY